jgi:adenylate cyclase
MPPTKKATTLSALRWLLLLPLPALWCVLSHFGALAFLENKLLDWRFQYRGELEAPVKVIYINVDSLSLAEIGGWPWSRMYFSRVASALVHEAQAKAVGFDFVFSDLGVSESVDLKKLVEGNTEFGRFLFRNPPVVLAASYAGYRFLDVNDKERERVLPLVASDPRKLADIEPPEIPAFKRNLNPADRTFYNPPNIGLIDTLDNGTRWVPAWAPNATGRIYFHMAFELARLYWGLPPGALRTRGDFIDFVRPDGTVLTSVPLRDRQLIEINWFTKWESRQNGFAEFSTVFKYAEALRSPDPAEQKAGQAFFAQNDFKDAVVLIGPVDPLFQDLAPTSLDAHSVPKVSVHGNLLKTIVAGKYLRHLPAWRGVAWLEFAVVFALTLLVSAFAAAGGTKGALAKLTAALLLVAYVFLAFSLFKEHHLVLPMAAPLGAAFTTSFAAIVWQLIEEEKQKGRIKGMFSAYLAPTVVNSLIDSGKEPELGGHEEEITAYFSDIQSFSTFSEVLTPARLVELMNEYLGACTDIVQAEGGTLDKYIGDAIVAMFGAPITLENHAERAVVATIRVQQRIEELRRKWRAQGDAWPVRIHYLRARLGLNTGPAIIGNMGSHSRFSYTMMGDNVNLAARMESGAKSLGVYTMITDATRAACEKHSGDKIVFRFLDKIVVKGRSIPVPVHEVVGFRSEIPQQTFDCLGVHAQAMERYLAQDWDGAIRLFEQSAALEPNQPNKAVAIESNPSLIMIERCHYMKAHPPARDWDGVWTMKEK